MANAVLGPVPVFRAFDASGLPLAGGKLYTYAAGTLTPLTTYKSQSEAPGNENTNPIILDANGEANVWFTSASYKLDLYDSTDVQQPNYPVDNYQPDQTTDAVAGIYANFANTSDIAKGDALVGVKQTALGSVATTQHAKNEDTISVKTFGVVGDGVTDDTTAMQTAFTNAAGRKLMVPYGTYYLPGNLTVTDDLILSGEGNGSRLVFNTTGVGIDLILSPSLQQKKILIENIAFDNITAVPSAFIRNSGFLNIVVRGCYFSNSSATNCIDNYVGYGLSVEDCVFSDVTGTGLYLRDDGAIAKYSYVTCVKNCDFTRISAAAVRAEGSKPLKFDGCVFETCAGGAVETNYGGGSGSIYTWGTHFDGCYFEGNTGWDVKLNTDGANYWGVAEFSCCVFTNEPAEAVQLGSKSKVQFNSCYASGTGTVVVSGSANAEAYLTNCVGINQSGSFFWDARNNTIPATYTPTIGNVTTSSVTAKYFVSDVSLCTVQVNVTVSAAPTGVITVTAPVTPSGNLSNTVVGIASATRVGVGYNVGMVWWDTVANVFKIHTDGGNNEWNATLPFGWVNGDNFQMSFSYFV